MSDDPDRNPDNNWTAIQVLEAKIDVLLLFSGLQTLGLIVAILAIII